jgi:hypothetical protein
MRESLIVRSIRAGALALALAVPFATDVRPAQADEACIPRSECCKVCDKGQAWGNVCISRAKNCHKGRGCACDADELCQ